MIILTVQIKMNRIRIMKNKQELLVDLIQLLLKVVINPIINKELRLYKRIKSINKKIISVNRSNNNNNNNNKMYCY